FTETLPPPPAPVAAGDGIEVVAKGASKFSLADVELLRASIKVRGAGTTIEGIHFDELKWDAEGLLPVVAQDRRTGAVLLLDRAKEPHPGSNTARLLAEPIEAVKAFVADANAVTKSLQGKGGNLPSETSDLLYHLLVSLRARGVSLEQVLTDMQAQHLAHEM